MEQTTANDVRGTAPSFLDSCDHIDGPNLEKLSNALTRGSTDDGTYKRQAKTVENGARITERATAMLERLEAFIDQLWQIPSDPEDRDRRSHLMRAVSARDDVELARLGLDLDYAWLDDVVDALIAGAPLVEIETVSPYAHHHLDDHGRINVQVSNLPSGEQIGIFVGSMLRDVLEWCPNLRFVALLDEFNNYVSRSDLGALERDRYVVEMYHLLRDEGVLRSGDVPGREYLLLRESELVDRVDDLIEGLRLCGRGVVESTDHGEVLFRPADPFLQQLALHSANRLREFKRRGILLTKQGIPACHALDAAGFLHPINRHVIHLLVLDSQYRAQQDKTYALLRALDLAAQETYHNVFYDSDLLSPPVVALALAELLAYEVRRHLQNTRTYRSWDEFDSCAYVEGNYGAILSADREIVGIVVEELDNANLPVGGASHVADIGSGPNIYPAMLLAPHLADGGRLDLIEYSKANRDYLETLLQGSFSDDEMLWRRFAKLMTTVGGDHYQDTLETVRATASVGLGSIFELAEDRYDIATSFFVAESITTSRRLFRLAIRSLARCIREDGLLIAAHMVGSLGYDTGTGRRFPAVMLAPDDIEEAYQDADLTFTLRLVGEGSRDRARDGYQSMALVVARRRPFNGWSVGSVC